jgi:hypothetical protein
LLDGFRVEASLYLEHCGILFRPGKTPRYAQVHNLQPGDTVSWPADDRQLLIEEARRQLDRQRAELDRIQSRSQFLFTTGLAVLALGTSLLVAVKDHGSLWATAMWIVATCFVLASIWGAAANLATKNVFGAIDAVLLSNTPAPRREAVGEAYIHMIAPGANTVATRLVIYRDAVFLLLVAVLLYIGASAVV